MYNEAIKLISKGKPVVNEYGDTVYEKSERTVFAKLKSIGQSEFYQAQAVGLKPEIKFVLPDYLEYEGEKQLKYQGYSEDEESLYEVIRTYRVNNELEIICKRGIE